MTINPPDSEPDDCISQPHRHDMEPFIWLLEIGVRFRDESMTAKTAATRTIRRSGSSAPTTVPGKESPWSTSGCSADNSLLSRSLRDVKYPLQSLQLRVKKPLREEPVPGMPEVSGPTGPLMRSITEEGKDLRRWRLFYSK